MVKFCYKLLFKKQCFDLNIIIGKKVDCHFIVLFIPFDI